MKGKQVIAFLLSAVLSISSCIPLDGNMGISAFAAQPDEMISEGISEEMMLESENAAIGQTGFELDAEGVAGEFEADDILKKSGQELFPDGGNIAGTDAEVDFPEVFPQEELSEAGDNARNAAGDTVEETAEDGASDASISDEQEVVYVEENSISEDDPVSDGEEEESVSGDDTVTGDSEQELNFDEDTLPEDNSPEWESGDEFEEDSTQATNAQDIPLSGDVSTGDADVKEDNPMESDIDGNGIESLEDLRELSIGSGQEESAQDAAALGTADSGSCGDYLTWTLDEGGTLTISGSGNMTDMWSAQPWDVDKIKKIVIETGVTRIGEGAFENCGNLIDVSIPETVTSIGVFAFSACTSLESVTIPDAVDTLGYQSFNDCSSLTNVTVSDSLLRFYKSAFKNTPWLTDFLSNIVDTDGFKIVRDVLILYSGDKNEVIIPDSVSAIGDDAFENNGLSKVTIPSGVTYIGKYAFSGCSSLESVTIPEGISELAEGLFMYCSALEKVTIPAGITMIDDGAFWYCSSLKSVTIPEGVAMIGAGAFCYCGGLQDLIVPEGVTKIEDCAFLYCTSLKSITIPASVVEIGDNMFLGCPFNLVMNGYAGSMAEEYANSLGITFNDLSTISLDQATVKAAAQTYSGKPRKPVPEVTVNGAALTMDTDFEVSYSNNINAGTAKVTVSGIGKYTGEKTASFVIKPASLAKASISGLTAKTYTGSAQKPAPVVKLGSVTLKAGTDYTVSYAGNTNAGTATVTITGKGNYTGTAKTTFTINKAAATLKFAKSSLTKKTTDSAFTNTLTKKTDGKVTFSSSNAGVAAVNASTGIVTVKKAGKTSITAKAAAGKNYKSVSASYTLTVEADGVNGIPKEIKLGVGQKYTLNPTVKNVTFSTSDANTAAVSSKGVITAQKAGTATIKVYSNKKLSASCKVTVAAAPKTVKLNISKATLGIAETCTLVPTISKDSYTTFTYTSKNAKIATVTSKGVVKGVKTGETTITVSTHNGRKASMTVTVVDAPSKITMSPADMTLGVKQSCTLKPAIPKGTHTTFTYTSKDSKIAAVSAKGVIQGVKTGKTTITVSTHNGKKATVTVTVKNAPSKVTISPSKLSLGVKEAYTLKPVIPDGTYTPFTYTSKDAKVATVSAKGVIQGVKTGKTTVTVSTYNGKSATVTVTVMNAPSKVTLSKTRLLMNTKGSFQLKAVLPENTASSITWKSSNANAVTVDKNGKLAAKAVGTARITATTFNKKSATCIVTVSDDFVFSGRTLVKYTGSSRNVSIPAANTEGNTILAIGDSVFEGNTTITKVSIPDTVKTIGNSSFKDCTALAEVRMPKNLQTIGEMAFCGDTALKSLKIPFGTTTVGVQAFANSGLEEIWFPDTVTTIAGDAFDGLPDVIFHAPAGSYAEEYANARDYQVEGNGEQYRKEELQRQMDIIEEMENTPEEEPIGEPEFPLIDTEGIEDEEILAFIEEINMIQLQSRNSYDEYLESAESFAEAYNALVEETQNLEIDASDDGIEMNCGSFSYGIKGDSIDNLGEDFEIISALATEDQEILKLEIESGGKRYYLVEDPDGITIYDKDDTVTINAGTMTPLTVQAATQITEGKLEKFLSYLSNALQNISNWAEGVKDSAASWLANSRNELAHQKAQKAKLQVKLLEAEQYAANTEGSTKELWEIIAKQSKEAITKQEENIKKAERIVAIAKKVSDVVRAWNFIEEIKSIKSLWDQFTEIREIKAHGHPTELDTKNTTLKPIADHLNSNITAAYIAIGGALAISGLNVIETISNGTFVIKAVAGPAGLTWQFFEKATVSSVKKIILNFMRFSAESIGVSMAASYYYDVIKKDDDLLHQGFVGGTVTDEETGKPLPRVEVSCGVTRVYTNSQGKYSIKIVGQGEHTIIFRKQGYNKREYKINLEEYLSRPLDVKMPSRGTLAGHVYDSETGEPIGGVTVSYGYYETNTDDEGYYEFVLKPGTEKMSFSMEGYVTKEFPSVKVECDKTKKRDAVLTKKLEDDQFRVVLTWGATPEDLDSHLEGPDFHVYYSDMEGPNAVLDKDDRESYGPETLTFKIDPKGTYKYYVFDYTNRDNSGSRALAGSGAAVTVYRGNEEIGAYSVPSGTGITWEVFTIRDGKYFPGSYIH